MVFCAFIYYPFSRYKPGVFSPNKDRFRVELVNSILHFELTSNVYLAVCCSTPVNKQLADKERVAAALENSQLLEVVNQCLSSRMM